MMINKLETLGDSSKFVVTCNDLEEMKEFYNALRLLKKKVGLNCFGISDDELEVIV